MGARLVLFLAPSMGGARRRLIRAAPCPLLQCLHFRPQWLEGRTHLRREERRFLARREVSAATRIAVTMRELVGTMPRVPRRITEA